MYIKIIFWNLQNRIKTNYSVIFSSSSLLLDCGGGSTAVFHMVFWNLSACGSFKKSDQCGALDFTIFNKNSTVYISVGKNGTNDLDKI